LGLFAIFQKKKTKKMSEDEFYEQDRRKEKINTQRFLVPLQV